MPCYIHRLTGTQPGCLACTADNAFYGGFLKGTYLWPLNIFKGVRGADRPDVEMVDKELRAVANIYRDRKNLREDYQQAKELYGELPTNVRAGIELGAIEAFGGLTAGMMLNSLISAFAGRGVANCVGARLGPQHRVFVRTPATIAISGLLTYFSLAATTINFAQMQNQLLNQNPDAKPIFDKALDKLSKRDDPDKKP